MLHEILRTNCATFPSKNSLRSAFASIALKPDTLLPQIVTYTVMEKEMGHKIEQKYL